MAAAQRRWAAELLHVWFRQLSSRDWFGSGAEVDTMLCRRFAPDYQALSQRPAADFLGDIRVAQAAILLFDQIPRNIFAARQPPSPPTHWHLISRLIL